MKANEYIKNYGWTCAGIRIAEIEHSKDFDGFYSDLKRLVESHELVAIHGFEKSKEIVANAPSDDHFYSWTLGDSGVRDKTVNIGELRKAIADVESCMEVNDAS